MAEVKIEINGTRAQLIVDGVDIAPRAAEYSLTQKAGEPAKLKVVFHAIDAVSTGDATVEKKEAKLEGPAQAQPSEQSHVLALDAKELAKALLQSVANRGTSEAVQASSSC